MSTSPTVDVVLADGADHTVRWRPGERLHHLFEEVCDRLAEHGDGDRLAVDGDAGSLTYLELDAQANQLARYLRRRGVAAGDRVALLFDGAPYTYVAMLAVSKAGAAFVPLDPGFPPDRLAFIVRDAGVRTVLTLTHLRELLRDCGRDVARQCLDEDVLLIADEPAARPESPRDAPANALAYVIYTSGSTGRPKGVAIEHGSICNFVRVAAEVYGVRGDDRMFQGMTIAFDFSVEEIWVPWAAAATLVPKPRSSGNLLGDDLAAFLRRNHVTAMCCVPTLLATLEPHDLTQLRFLLVSGEACPPDLVARWHRVDRRFLNVYGPTEATVTATWTELQPGAPVTIGVPLPTYTAVILDEVEPRALPRGSVGELAIAGVCLSSGYVNRDDLTARAFIPDFLDLPHNPSGRIYRTGDLARVNDDGEIEYLGRIDTQVKIRGYRVELGEVEAVVRGVDNVGQAVVTTHEAQPGVVDLVAYVTRRNGVPVDARDVVEHVRGVLPRYMVPAYVEELDALPTLPSGKVDHARLPPPRGGRVGTGSREVVAPGGPLEMLLAEELSTLLGVDTVSVDDHFFDDLGANSLLLAQFCTRVRNRMPGVDIAMKDAYQHPSVREFAAFIAARQRRAPAESASPRAARPAMQASRLAYYACGAAQFVAYCAYVLAGSLVFVHGYAWVTRGDGAIALYERAVVFGLVVFASLSVLPLAGKWLLLGRWKPASFAIWSVAYFRFWVVRQLMRASPMRLFLGTPLYNLYLRSMGAKVGRHALVLSPNVVCTDLVRLGEGAIVRAEVWWLGYRAEAGRIDIGAIDIGDDAIVGEGAVLDIGTRIEAGGQLAHASCVHEGQVVPAGRRFHGNPAEDASAAVDGVEPRRCSAARRVWYSLGQLAVRFLVEAPLGVGAIGVALYLHVGTPLGSLIVWPSLLLIGLLLTIAGPRLLAFLVVPGRAYALFGFRHWVFDSTNRMSNSHFYNNLFGDSSYVVHYLRALGYDLSRVEQTGSNFGVAQKQKVPSLCFVGTGTMVSDGLSLVNVDYSRSSFVCSPCRVGAKSFLGNNIVWPGQSRVGDDCLLATKVMVPTQGTVRRHVGLLGSPPFEIPRSVRRDAQFDAIATGPERDARLRRKNRSNVLTMSLFLATRWLYVYVVAMVMLRAVGRVAEPDDAFVLAASLVGLTVFTAAYFVLVERCSLGFGRLQPQYCSIYDPYYWRHERYWKLNDFAYLELFNGTPFKNVVWRLLGVRIGRQVFDDGCAIVEKTLVEIGDHCTLGPSATLQSHSLEDGTFKSDRIVLGSGCTVGTNAFVPYGVVAGDDVVVGTDAFLMKGEAPRAGSRWDGNPAREVHA
jgi:non-ribosomal peptide synthetase-like protein